MSYIVFDLETIHDSDNFVRPEDDKFPPAHQHHIVAIGRVLLNDNLVPTKMTCPASPNEHELLQSFCDSVEHYSKKAILVSWNGRRFDFPCLVARCLHHRISIPWYWQNRKLRMRYEAHGHMDLCDVMSEYGAGWFMSLNDAAVLCGIPGKVGEGASVEELVSEGRWEALRDYCQNDLRITSHVLARHRYAAGQLSEAHLSYVEAAWEMWLAGELDL